MGEQKKIKLFVVDDHAIIINGIKSMVTDQDDIEFVGAATSIQEALQKIKELKKEKKYPDVFLIDIKLKKENGIDLIRQILEANPNANVAALTMFDDDEYIRNVMRTGARGYILKNTSKEDLLTGIRKLAEGKKYLSDEALDVITEATSVSKGFDRNVKLTDKEKVILKLIASQYTNKKIAERLKISPRTVHTHRRSLMSKLGVKNTAGLVRRAMELDLIDEDIEIEGVFEEGE